MRRLLILVMVLSVAPPGWAERYRPGPLPGWQEIIFAGHTRYTPGQDCVQAESRQAASGLIREIDQPLAQAPWLTWQWRADAPLQQGQPAPEKTRAGDDFVARVYVIREGLFPWQTRAINYVWSREHPVGSHWPNPFTGNAMMVVVQSGEDGLGQWHQFDRDIRADFRRYFSIDVEAVDAVAIMTDTDNSQGRADACYRLPALVAEPASP